jgi:isoquinoline 1-oxidoreductase subunit beta
VLVTYAKAELPVTIWFWRSVGSSQNAWMVECFLDELARAGGKDPVEVRRRLLAGHPRHLGVLEAAVAKAGWGTPLPEGRARGVAVHESFGSYVAEIAEVSIEAGAPRVHRVVCAIDCGRIVNPDTIAAQMESGIYYGLSAALHGAIALDGGAVRTSNFHDYPVVRLPQAPVIETVIVPSEAPPGGVGEPSTPPIAPAVCNALLALTGKPIRALPIRLV